MIFRCSDVDFDVDLYVDYDVDYDVDFDVDFNVGFDFDIGFPWPPARIERNNVFFGRLRVAQVQETLRCSWRSVSITSICSRPALLLIPSSQHPINVLKQFVSYPLGPLCQREAPKQETQKKRERERERETTQGNQRQHMVKKTPGRCQGRLEDRPTSSSLVKLCPPL